MRQDALDWRGISDLVNRLTREQFMQLWAQFSGAQQQTILAQVGSMTTQALPVLGGQDPAAVDHDADEGSSTSGARADHAHALDLSSTDEGISVGGTGAAFTLTWAGFLADGDRATELAVDGDLTLSVVDGIATISDSWGTWGTKFGPPASGSDGIDLSGARWHKYGSDWVQVSPGVALNWGGTGSDDILIDANWEGGAKADPYRVIEPEVALWEYTAASGWTDLTSQTNPMVPAAPPPYSAARSTAALLPLPADTDWLIEGWSVVAAGGLGTWDASHRWDISLMEGATTHSTVQQITQDQAVHEDAVDTVVSGGSVLHVLAAPVLRPGTLVSLAASVKLRRVRQV